VERKVKVDIKKETAMSLEYKRLFPQGSKKKVGGGGGGVAEKGALGSNLFGGGSKKCKGRKSRCKPNSKLHRKRGDFEVLS